MKPRPVSFCQPLPYTAAALARAASPEGDARLAETHKKSKLDRKNFHDIIPKHVTNEGELTARLWVIYPVKKGVV